MTAHPRAASTQHQLLDAARDAFEAQGYRGTSVADIVARAATARGTFYLYFDNKDDAFARVVADLCDELLRETRTPWPEGDRAASVEAATRDYLTVFAARRGLWRATLEAFSDSPAVGERWLELRKAFIERIARNLRRGQERGEVRALDAELTAEALAAMTEWVAYTELVVRGAPADGERFDGLVRTIADLWVLGTAPDHADGPARR